MGYFVKGVEPPLPHKYSPDYRVPTSKGRGEKGKKRERGQQGRGKGREGRKRARENLLQDLGVGS